MIKEFIDRFDANKETLRSSFAKAHPNEYKDIVVGVVNAVRDGDKYGQPDPNRIHEIDDGNHSGTLVYVIGEGGYEPHEYWYVRVSYGSCSGCDTLEGIHEYSDEPPTEEQINEYMMLATHILQGLKRMGDDDQTGPY